MTETTFTSPRLERPADTALGGVATALARTTGTDVVLWRVLFVVLTFFGGLGAALYLAAYCAIPAEGAEQSLLERLLTGPDRRVTTRQLLLLALVAIVSAGVVHNNGGAVFAVVAAGIGYLVYRRVHRPDGPASPSLVPPSAPSRSTGVGASPAQAAPTGPSSDARSESAADVPAPPPITWQPLPPRERSVLTPLVLSVAALAVGVLLLLAAAGTVSVPTEVVLATALGTVGLGLVVSSVWGRARGLVPVAILLSLALGGTAAARPAIDDGIGERRWTAAATGSYRLGIGEATLSLPEAALDGGHVDAWVGIGSLQVEVPAGLHVVVRADVGTGDIQGLGVDENGRDVSHDFELGPEGAPVLTVDAHVGLGQVEVRRVG
jgi:phage shock protein PspC (stress-responsive transcriptional regulator)